MTRNSVFAVIAACGLTVAAPVPARAQDPRSVDPRTSPASSLAPTDVAFLEKAAKMGLMEIEQAQMAIRLSKTPSLVSAANKIKLDHERMHKELIAIAKRGNYIVPELTPAEKTVALGKLAEMSGGEFDKEWTARMIRDHNDAIDLCTSATSSSNLDVAGFAMKMLPMLRDHLKLVEAMF